MPAISTTEVITGNFQYYFTRNYHNFIGNVTIALNTTARLVDCISYNMYLWLILYNMYLWLIPYNMYLWL